MICVVVSAHVKPECLEEFKQLIIEDAIGSLNNENGGCLRFDVIQDEEDPNLIRFYEVYRDEEAVAFHRQTPHYFKFRDGTADMYTEPRSSVRGRNLYPPDEDWG